MTQKVAQARPNAQRTYRKKQTAKGLVRFELQVHAESKAQFDAMVAVVAEEYPAPWNPRQRLARARAQVFDEITQQQQHEFFALKDQITQLKAEITALSPNMLLSTPTSDATPLPEAIGALPDDPAVLKPLLAKTHQEATRAQHRLQELQRRANQYQQLYEVASDYNELLKARLEAHGLTTE